MERNALQNLINWKNSKRRKPFIIWEARQVGKTYLAGMFSYQSGIYAASFVSGERENTLFRIFFENFVASELTAKRHKLFYWLGKGAAKLGEAQSTATSPAA